jgi:hypothetical protein
VISLYDGMVADDAPMRAAEPTPGEPSEMPVPRVLRLRG